MYVAAIKKYGSLLAPSSNEKNFKKLKLNFNLEYGVQII